MEVRIPAPAAISVFSVDNQEFVRDALVDLLDSAGFEVVGEAPLGNECLRLVADRRPDVVLLEPFSNGSGGLEWVARLAVATPESRIIVFTGAQAHDPVLEAIVAGACGYMLKEAPPSRIVAAVEAAARGESVACPGVADELLERIRTGGAALEPQSNGAATEVRGSLTERELEIFRRLPSGRTNREIASEVSLSEHTVKNHVASILDKLRLENRVQAAVAAVRSGVA
jgi:DNA-binding NarL/FixJ family response regulator